MLNFRDEKPHSALNPSIGELASMSMLIQVNRCKLLQCQLLKCFRFHSMMTTDRICALLRSLTAKVSGPPLAGPLERRVRPEGQKGAPNLEDGRNPRKGAGPPKRSSAARMIASSARCTSARGQKSLKPTKRTQAKPSRAPKPQGRNL
mgnify:CR=1 FL=1